MRQWRADALPDASAWTSILLAVAEHDNGWREVDAVPIVDDRAGRILDFVETPDPIKMEVWPRGVERLGGTPYAAALVAQHALHIYRRHRNDTAWAPFFTAMEAARDRHLQQEPSLTLDRLQREYLLPSDRRSRVAGLLQRLDGRSARRLRIGVRDPPRGNTSHHHARSVRGPGSSARGQRAGAAEPDLPVCGRSTGGVFSGAKSGGHWACHWQI